MKINNSCYGCKERHLGCHANCEKYKEYVKALDVINKNKHSILEYERLGHRRYRIGK